MTNAMNGNEVELHAYVSPMRLEANRGITLAEQLAAAAPPDLTESGRAALANVGVKAEAVSAVLTYRSRTSVGGLRPVLAAFDTAWSAMNGRLVSAAKLSAGPGDIALRATALIAAVLIDGVAFLVADAETRYAQSRRRLTIIAEKRLDTEIEEIAGAGFLDAVKLAHRALGDALGTGATPLHIEGDELQVAVNELSIAIADYGLQVAAQVDRGDTASVRKFRAAMLPIDVYRAPRASAGEEEGDAEPVTPVIETPAPSPGGPFPSPFLPEPVE